MIYNIDIDMYIALSYNSILSYIYVMFFLSFTHPVHHLLYLPLSKPRVPQGTTLLCLKVFVFWWSLISAIGFNKYSRYNLQTKRTKRIIGFYRGLPVQAYSNIILYYNIEMDKAPPTSIIHACCASNMSGDVYGFPEGRTSSYRSEGSNDMMCWEGKR